ncbi:DUF2188 domain-containing protein [Naasia lichenicola]|uniref:DUF2188 domain-containing protein n=1 Tax=Naasia lichenicola TaxID=2565933 RepID=A0A4S4FLB4_9MICO|nr:DUF2188 domain-containing protein [Naasia lichenicola]THG29996.1 DUF2188 domain-containing protein [Naasia lichenicola]
MAQNDEDRYVVHNSERGGWDVEKEDARRVSSHESTQADAIARAKQIVGNTGEGEGDIRIQGRDGAFRDGISGADNETSAPDKVH